MASPDQPSRLNLGVQMMREGIAKHGGYEINTEGDAFQVGVPLSECCLLYPGQPTADLPV